MVAVNMRAKNGLMEVESGRVGAMGTFIERNLAESRVRERREDIGMNASKVRANKGDSSKLCTTGRGIKVVKPGAPRDGAPLGAYGCWEEVEDVERAAVAEVSQSCALEGMATFVSTGGEG